VSLIDRFEKNEAVDYRIANQGIEQMAMVARHIRDMDPSPICGGPSMGRLHLMLMTIEAQQRRVNLLIQREFRSPFGELELLIDPQKKLDKR
jgi:hypothetical protein